jgi:hypothetical protein
MVLRAHTRAPSSLLIGLLLGAAIAAPTLTIAKQRQGHGADPGWATYRNERYAFRLSYPAESRVDTRRGHGFQHVSISRDGGEPADAAQAAEFHIDVLIYDHRLGHKLKTGCRDLLQDAHAVKVGKIQGLRGIYPAGDDQAEPRPAVCVESRKLDIVVKASDPDQQAPIADRILDSLRFGE